MLSRLSNRQLHAAFIAEFGELKRVLESVTEYCGSSGIKRHNLPTALE